MTNFIKSDKHNKHISKFHCWNLPFLRNSRHPIFGVRDLILSCNESWILHLQQHTASSGSTRLRLRCHVLVLVRGAGGSDGTYSAKSCSWQPKKWHKRSKLSVDVLHPLGLLIVDKVARWIPVAAATSSSFIRSPLRKLASASNSLILNLIICQSYLLHYSSNCRFIAT